MVYVFALICRIAFGGENSSSIEEVYPYFDTTTRAMLTVFRCSFGDCSTDGGTPIPEYIVHNFGGFYGLCYAMFVFFITIGLFNVISAIFVDSTMSATARVEAKRKQERLDDEHRWAGSVAIIMRELLTYPQENDHEDLHGLAADMRGRLDELVHVEFSRHTIEQVIKGQPGVENKTRDALDELDIEPQDHKRLSDILDPDHSGTIGVLELVEGLRRLRGEPRRSDVVCVDLMVRSMQEKVEEICERTSELLELSKAKYMKIKRYYDV